MKDENKAIFSPSLFDKCVRRAMKEKSMSIDELCERINDAGYEITKNNLSVYLQRSPNVNFLIALCDALEVPADYLLGRNQNYFLKGFDYKFRSDRYKKYIGKYFFYFFPTASNSLTHIETATLYFNENFPHQVELEILVQENDTNNIKNYSGDFILSTSYNVGYISLKGQEIGECVYLSLLDPVINNKNMKVQFLVGAMLSVSAGSLKRVPVMSRFILSRNQIPQEKLPDVIANLRLNSKYIILFEDKLLETVSNVGLGGEKTERVTKQLENAFQRKGCFVIEESYVLNTLKNDCELSTDQAISLLDALRNNSQSNIHSKLNAIVDARMYKYLFGATDSLSL